jgi:hypothetical protein
MSYLTTDTLIESVIRRAAIPANQSTFTNSDFLAFANEEMSIGLIPSIMSVHEEYYVYTQLITLESDKSRYPIPYRAIGGKLRDIFYKTSSDDLVEMSKINPEDKAVFQNTSANTGFNMYYIEGNDIVLTPAVGTAPVGYLQVSYFLRPSSLVSESRVAIITAITTDGDDTVFTVDGVPTGFTSSTEMDINQAKSGHRIRNFDVTPTSVTSVSKTITFATADISSDTVVGDHITFAGECMIPQAPSDLHPVLAQRVACRVLEAQKDLEGLASANQKLAEMEVKLTTLIDSRVDGAPIKINNQNGLLRYSKIKRKF